MRERFHAEPLAGVGGECAPGEFLHFGELGVHRKKFIFGKRAWRSPLRASGENNPPQFQRRPCGRPMSVESSAPVDGTSGNTRQKQGRRMGRRNSGRRIFASRSEERRGGEEGRSRWSP